MPLHGNILIRCYSAALQIRIIIFIDEFLLVIKFSADGNSETVGKIFAKITQKYIFLAGRDGAPVRTHDNIRQKLLELPAAFKCTEADCSHILMQKFHLLSNDYFSVLL